MSNYLPRQPYIPLHLFVHMHRAYAVNVKLSDSVTVCINNRCGGAVMAIL